MTDEDRNSAIDGIEDALTILGSDLEGVISLVPFRDIKEELLLASHHLQNAQELLRAVDLI